MAENLKKGEFIMCLDNILTPINKASEQIKPVFTASYSEDLIIKLIEFHKKKVKATITFLDEPKNKKDVITIESEFEARPGFKAIASGDKAFLILQAAYEKRIHRDLVELYKNDCKIFLEEVEPELPMNTGSEDDQPEIL